WWSGGWFSVPASGPPLASTRVRAYRGIPHECGTRSSRGHARPGATLRHTARGPPNPPIRIAPVIPRYSRPAMARIWSEEATLERWLAVELAAVDAWAQVGTVPRQAASEIRSRARVPDPARVAELERETNHDLAAFVDAVSETLGSNGRWLHFGLTSSDVV